MLRAENISHAYFENTPWSKKVLSNVTLEVKKGELTVLVGSNGSGKTTLGKIVAGLMRPTSGKVIVGSVDLYSKAAGNGSVPIRLGFVHQKPELHFFGDTVLEELTWEKIDKKEYNQSLSLDDLNKICLHLKLDLEKIRNRSPFLLSSSEQRKVALAAFFFHDPDVLILDEPLAGLSREDSKRVVSLILNQREKGRGILIISHELSILVDVADRVIKLDNKRITELVPGRELPPED